MQSICQSSTSYNTMTKPTTIMASSSASLSPNASISTSNGTSKVANTVANPLTTAKSSSIFGSRSFWGLKENLLSGLSSRLEAFHSSFSEPTESPVSTMSTTTTTATISTSSPAGSACGSPCTGKQRRRPKIRSIFGQPEMPSFPVSNSLQRSKDTSMDSLDTLDSGQSMGGSSCVSVAELRGLEQHDSLKPYRTGDSIGIGSGQETSLESSEAEEDTANVDERLLLMIPGEIGIIQRAQNHQNYSNNSHHRKSRSSLQSWASNLSYDSQLEDDDDEIRRFMLKFVNKIFDDSSSITLTEKALFGAYARTDKGRLYFSRFINEKRVYQKQVSESTFYSLVQYFAIILFECSESDDFSPAKTILNMCFTFYHEANSGRASNSAQQSFQQQHGQQRKASTNDGNSGNIRQYLYQYLKEQPIWRSHRFWSAAFFDSVLCEKAKSPVHERSSLRGISQSEREEEAQLQENTIFGQLGAFTYYIKEFGLPEKFCLEFLQKQAAIGNLSKDQVFTLRQNVTSLYSQ